jgi:hypothetical protein
MADPTPNGGPDDPVAQDRQRHDRRYKVFAAVFGGIVLLFAAVSITVVILAS